MTALQFDISCPKCGHDLNLITQGKGGTSAHRAVLNCKAPYNCGYRWVLSMELLHSAMTPDGEATRCGTIRGYEDHRRNGTNPCDLCTLVNYQKNLDNRAAWRLRKASKVGSK